MIIPLILAATVPLDGCAITLTDIASLVGLPFRHERGTTPDRRLPETMGAGLAWLDYDRDGFLDLYVVQSGPFPPAGSPRAQDRLFRNVDGRTFTDVTDKARLFDRAYGMGAVAADYDNDGDVDLYVTNVGRNILYRNNGDGTFSDVTDHAGVGAGGWSTSAAWGDIDGDGFLDLFVTRYVDYSVETDYFCGDVETGLREYCHPDVFPGVAGILFRNDGDGGFAEMTARAGVDRIGKGLGVVFTDVDQDGRLDFYVANDNVMNFLFRNVGGGRFEDVSLVSGTALDAHGAAQAGMGVDAGDVDGDGLLDLVVTNFDVEFNTLYRNLGNGLFEDVSAPSGFGPPSFNLLGFGVNLADFDNDGDLDAYIANGHIQDRPHRQGVAHAQRDLLLWNDGRGRFVDRPCGPAFAQSFVGRGTAVADFDNDGDLDVAVSNSDGPLQLLRNDGEHGNWIGFALRGRGSNRQGIGARLVVETSAGRRVAEARAGSSYLSSSDPRLHVGVGRAASVRRVEIRWPSGVVQELKDLTTGRYHPIEEPDRR